MVCLIKKWKKLYRYNDWEEISAEDPHYLSIGDHKVPYVVFNNKDDVTTAKGPQLAERLEKTLQKLWEIKISK